MLMRPFPMTEEEDAPLLPGAEQAGDIGVVPLSLLQAEAAAEEQAEVLPEAADAVLDADAMDALLDEAEAAGAVEPSAVSPILPKGFAAASEREEPVAEAPQPKLSWFQRLRAGLARTSSQLTTQISALFTKRKLDEDTLDELEDLLIQSDLGVETAMRITGALSSERYGKDVSGEDVARIMAGEITKVLKPVAKPLELDLSHKPHVILVVGVNGTGKTTTIGKLASSSRALASRSCSRPVIRSVRRQSSSSRSGRIAPARNSSAPSSVRMPRVSLTTPMSRRVRKKRCAHH